jgi:RecB family exonuclease
VGQSIRCSSTVLEHLMLCPTQWFLEREAGGVARAHQAANLGLMVHALAERVARGELDAAVDDGDALMTHVDEVWDRLEFRTPWSKVREHDRTRAALARFLRWHHTNSRTVLGVEQEFAAVVTVEGPDGEQVPVRLTGYADRVELAADGGVVVVDLKTTRTMPTGTGVKQHRQLALYQFAVDAGAVDDLLPEPGSAHSGGAELVQLGSLDDADTAVVQAQDPPSPDGPERRALRAELGLAARMLRDEEFPAVPGAQCRDCSFVSICPARSAGSVTG